MTAEFFENVDVVLQTKLHRPPVPVDLVKREDLVELLNKERSRPLTLVSAPAGYGKSMLVASWLEQSDWSSVWLSLDADDSDLRIFLTYIVVALRQTYAGVCEQTHNLLKAAELPSVNIIATVLANELDAIEQPFILVLDDYHRINAASPIHDLLERLLAHPPIPLHLVIITRLDPPLSLERQRALGQVTDIRVLDLRLNLGETRRLLQTTTGSEASETALHNLDRELEGWVVGLKLVALALRHSSDPDELLSRFRGGTREIQAYLVDEVLAILPRDIRDCLTRTAVLDRFCAPLCDALCEQSHDASGVVLDGKSFMQSAYNENLFLIPLDSRGEWYRYHHLFQELLQRELISRMDAQAINSLHLTASLWLEKNDFIEEAIHHALAGGDELAAVEIVERHRHAQLNADNWYVVERWLQMLPSIKEHRPNLLLARAWIAYERYQIAALPDILQRISGLIDAQAEGTVLWGEVQFLQGAALYFSGQGKASQDCFKIADACLSQEYQLFLGLTHLLGGLSTQMRGNTKQAIDTLNNQLLQVSSKQSLYVSRVHSGLFFTYMMSGDLENARSETIRMESVATSGRIQYTVAWSLYMRACTFLHNYDLEQAARLFDGAAKHCYILHRSAAVESFAGLALCQQLMGQQDAAQQTVRQLLDFVRELNDPSHLTIAQSCKARIDVLRGSLVNASAWAGNNTEPPEFAEMFTWMEVPALNRIRVWIALGSEESLIRACDLLEEIITRSQSWNLVNHEIEAGALLSLALEKLGRAEDAIACLVKTLQMATPGGWVRPFLELGQPMAALLSRLHREQEISDFSHQLVSLLSSASVSTERKVANEPDPVGISSLIQEKLTRRELSILELLAQRLQNKEIAARLFVSPETVKSHIKRLYQKLDVHNRRDAAAMARQMITAKEMNQ